LDTLTKIKKYKTKELINYLCMEKDLKLDKDDYKIIHKEKIAGCNLFNLTNKELRDWGMAGGPARRLLNFTSEIKEKMSRAFSLTNMSS
jgi:hypothetical protein